MQSDDVIWSVINTQFCSYKVKYVRALLGLSVRTRADRARTQDDDTELLPE
jgi:hypothetical protein